MEYKYCNECKQLLPYSAFKVQHNTADGYSVRCLECIRKDRHERERHRIANLDVTQVCNSCKELKVISDFNVGQHKCKQCIKRDRDAKKSLKPAKKKVGASIGTVILGNGKVVQASKLKKKGWNV